jgi:hypothetical protein
MNELEKIAHALKKDAKLKDGAIAALDAFSAAISGETRHISAKYASWLELDSALKDVKLETLKSSHLRKLFRLALSLAIRATTKD